MRAVSIRVSESTGVVALLRAGNKVDVQAVSDHNNLVQLRTILQNVEVLAVSPQTELGPGGRITVPVVTVLPGPQDADVLALADSGARVRLVLRNPLDEGTVPRRPLALGTVFQPGRDAGNASEQQTPRGVSTGAGPTARAAALAATNRGQ